MACGLEIRLNLAGLNLAYHGLCLDEFGQSAYRVVTGFELSFGCVLIEFNLSLGF